MNWLWNWLRTHSDFVMPFNMTPTRLHQAEDEMQELCRELGCELNSARDSNE